MIKKNNKMEKTLFVCKACGYQSPKWFGKCPHCGQWNSFSEQKIVEKKSGIWAESFPSAKPVVLNEIKIEKEKRVLTGIDEFDSLLSGGIVEGTLILIGGSPGIGKSTLLLQVANNLSKERKIMYISGEESQLQVKIRAERLHLKSERLYIFTETNMEHIFKEIEKLSPEFVIIDSIQTLYLPDVLGMPGSISQVRECAGKLLYLAKTKNITIFITSHITKGGDIAGPKVLEHIVDTVLYFEESKQTSYRILRAEKNRFGRTNEIGVFEMKSEGLFPVEEPSKLFLLEDPKENIGTTIVSIMEGSRPMLLEFQILVNKTSFSLPRRQVSGFDYNRFLLLIGVLEKQFGIELAKYDLFFNIVSGIKVKEPASDLGVVVALYSALKSKPIRDKVVFIGEVGLNGEVRHVSFIDKRVREAKKLGFNEVVVPFKNMKDLKDRDIYGISNIREIVNFLK